jgi:hypothetical protein
MRALWHVPRCARSCAALRLSGAAGRPRWCGRRQQNACGSACDWWQALACSRLQDFACSTCDAVQAAAAALLAPVAVACGGGEALRAAARRNVLPPLAALLLARAAAHERKPALKREATRTLALLLALRLTSGVDGGHAQNDDALSGGGGPPAPRQRPAGTIAGARGTAAHPAAPHSVPSASRRAWSGRGVPACVVLSLMRG